MRSLVATRTAAAVAATLVLTGLQDYRDKNGVYRTPAWHMIGTCRMGSDPQTSVVNKWNQTWEVPNLFIVDGSVLATGGVVNPTPTISALALRADYLPALLNLGKPEEAAGPILWLASDDSTFVTGAAFVVDGGMVT